MDAQSYKVVLQDEVTSIETLADQWIRQHNNLARKILVLNVVFKCLRRLKLDPHGWLGKVLILAFCLSVFSGLPLITTAVADQWSIAPIVTWLSIATIFGITFLSFEIYSAIGANVCSISRTVRDIQGLQSQVSWDSRWFSLRMSGFIGAVTALAVTFSFVYLRNQLAASDIPVGTFTLFALLSYQIGEIAYNNLLMCFEARNFSMMRHELYRFSPLDTFELQRAVRGYNQFGLVTSLVLTVYIASSGLLLPDLAYLTNPIWLSLILAVYLITILGVVVPRLYVQKIVRDFKHAQLIPLRNRIDFMYDQLDSLDKREYEEMSRLVAIQEKIQKAPDACIQFSTLGRMIGTLFLPTFTFLLTVAGEVYVSKIFEGIFR